MANERKTVDLVQLRRALQSVMDSARVESQAVNATAHDCSVETLKALRVAHLAELDAIQALVALLELFERQLKRQQEAWYEADGESDVRSRQQL